MSLLPVANCHRCHLYWRQFAAGVVDTGGKFATGINNTRETGGKICRRSRDTVPLTAGRMANAIALQRNILEIQKTVVVLI